MPFGLSTARELLDVDHRPIISSTPHAGVGELVMLEYGGLPVVREFSLTEGAVGELAVIWDLADAINVCSWRVIMVLELGQAWDPGEDDGSEAR
jgi:hypothetical protein